MEISETIKAIQYVVAPAVMVSSSALLLLGFQTKFSNLASRFRLLNNEKRLLVQKTVLAAFEEDRLQNLERQLEQLMRRAFFIRNAILAAYSGIVGFSVSSVLIFADLYLAGSFHPWIVGVFMLGFACVLAACVFMIVETQVFYRVMRLEDAV